MVTESIAPAIRRRNAARASIMAGDASVMPAIGEFIWQRIRTESSFVGNKPRGGIMYLIVLIIAAIAIGGGASILIGAAHPCLGGLTALIFLHMALAELADEA